jgi:hypothetical protein
MESARFPLLLQKNEPDPHTSPDKRILKSTMATLLRLASQRPLVFRPVAFSPFISDQRWFSAESHKHRNIGISAHIDR